MDDLVERCAAAGHAAVQSLLAEYDADHDRPVSQRECDEVFARAIIPMVLEHAAKVSDEHVEPAESDYGQGWRDASHSIAAAIRAIGAP